MLYAQLFESNIGKEVLEDILLHLGYETPVLRCDDRQTVVAAVRHDVAQDIVTRINVGRELLNKEIEDAKQSKRVS